METIILGGGCFWCTEAAFRAVKGVVQIRSGYAGGSQENANYKAVCAGNTQHVEVVEVIYDNTIIDTRVLLTIFFSIHNPTTLNQQGNDVGTQYASVVFCSTDEQIRTANTIIDELIDSGINVMTRVDSAPVFYPAEAYHQNYYAKNPCQGYCNAMIPPKLYKIQTKFIDYFIS